VKKQILSLFSGLFVVCLWGNVLAQCPIPNACTPGAATNPQASLFGCGIFQVKIGSTFDNVTGGAAEGFQDYCALGNIQIQLGTPTPVYVKTGNNVAENLKVYLDVNNDQAFTEAEVVFTSTNAKVHTGSFQVSTGTTGQPIKLRISSDAVVAALLPGPCTTPEYSQVEDYAVILGINSSPPLARFGVSDTLTCSGSVIFSDQSLNNPTEWLWNFGDGQTSNLQNPAHQYQQAGVYSVKLKVSNASGSDSLTKTNFVRYNDTLPIAAACSPATLNQCCGYGITRVKINSIDNSSGLGSYESFTCDQRTTLLQGLSYPIEISTNPNQNQDTRVWIDYNGDGIFSGSELVFESLNSKNPTGSILISSDTSVKVNRALRIRVMSESAGVPFSFCTNLDKGQCEDYTVVILPNTNPPVASFTLNAVNGFCQPVYEFTSTSINAIQSYHWFFGDGSDSVTTAPQVSHVYSQFGSYDVKLIVSGPFGTDSLKKVKAVNYLGAPKEACAAPTQTGGGGGGQFGSGIGRVEFGSINKRSEGFQEGYQDFTCTDQTSALAGSQLTLTVRNFTEQNSKVRAWIDWDNSGTFEDDELVLNSQNDTVHSAPVVVPADAIADSVLRMRVVTNLQQVQVQPPSCGPVFAGQAEDYGVIVKAITSKPIAGFTVDRTVSCTGIVQFSDTSSNVPSSWNWNFGDGNSSTEQAPQHTYQGTGSYTVSLIVSNNFGSDTLVKENYVSVSQLTGMVASECFPLASGACCQYGISKVIFAGIDQSSGPATEGYRDFTCTTIGSAQIASAVPITIINSGTSNENVGVWIDWDNDGAFADNELVLSSIGSTTHGGNISIPGNAPAGLGLRMRVKSVAGTQAIGGACEDMDFGQAEDYQIVLTGNSQPPQTLFTASETISCNKAIQFSDTSFNAPTSWLWNFGDGNTSDIRNPIHEYQQPGVYTVSLISSNSFGSDTLVKEAYITIIDNKNLKPAPCTPQTNNIQNNPGVGIRNVTFNTINRESPTAPDETYSDNSCLFRTELEEGQSYSLSVQTSGNFNENCRAWIDWNNNGTFEDPAERILTGTNSNAFSANISIPQAAVRDTALRMRVMSDAAQGGPGGGGNIQPCNNLNFGQCEDYAIIVKSNINPPLASFGALNTFSCSGSVQFRDSSTYTPVSWLWNFGDGNTSSQQNPLHQYQNPGTYTVKLRVSNAFGSDSLTRTNYISVSGLGGPAAPSCVNTVANPGATFGIELVQFGTMTSVSGLALAEGGYLDKTCSDTALVIITQPNQVESISVNTSSGQTRENCRVYIDFNNDGIFSNTESVLNSQNNIVHSANLTLTPAQCLGLPVRMRVISDTRFAQINSACYNPQQGQVEDFSVRLIWNYFNTSPPVASFASATNLTCSGYIQFSDSSQNEPSAWKWNFGDGNTSNSRNPLHLYQQPGIYTVKLIVSNAYGTDSLVVPNIITVTGNNGILPIACRSNTQNPGQNNGTTQVRFGNMTAVNGLGAEDGGYVDYTCTDSALVVVSTAGQVDSINVNTSAGNTNENCRVYIDFNNDGIFAASERVLISNNSKRHRAALTLTAERCLGVPVRMRVMTDNPNNQLANACSFIQAGQQEDYRVRLVWAAPATQAPEARISSVQKTTCNGVIQFRDSSRYQAESWLWNFGDGQTSTQKNPLHVYSNPGSYTVKLKVTNTIGQDSVTIPDYITVTGLSGIIPPSCFPSVASPSATNGTTRVRFANLDKTSGLAAADGGYVDYTCTDSAVVTITGFQSINLTVNTSAGNNAENCRVYIDYNNNGTFESDELVLNGNNNNVHTAVVTPAVYQCLGVPVRMRVITDNRFNQIYNACYSPAQGQVEDYSVRITNPASVFQPRTSPEILVYPNPSAGEFTLRGFGEGLLRWDVCDLSGKVVSSGSDFSAGSEMKFDLRLLPAGMYQLRISGDNGPVIRKISIEK
jgi:PKD repeat protein